MIRRGERSDPRPEPVEEPPAPPLQGKRVLVLRAAEQSSALAERIRSLGGEPVEAAAIEIRPGDRMALRLALADLAEGRFAGLCLTSANGVDALAAAVLEAGLDARAFAGLVVGCVGPSTARRLREQLGIEADVVGDPATSAGLARVFPAGEGRVLLPRGDLATTDLPDALAARGWTPVDLVAYRTRRARSLPRTVLEDLASGRIEVVTFTSASTVHAFSELLAGRPFAAQAVSIGPETSRACRAAGITVAAEAEPHDIDGLVAAAAAAIGHPSALVPDIDWAPDPGPLGQSPAITAGTRARLQSLDAARPHGPVPVRQAVGFVLGVGALAGMVGALRPWEWESPEP